MGSHIIGKGMVAMKNSFYWALVILAALLAMPPAKKNARGSIRMAATVGFGLMLVLTIGMAASAAPSLSTDKADYAPEMVVTISGTDFAPGAITLTVTRPDGHVDSIAGVLADSAGNFTATYQLDGITGTYTIDAADSAGQSAQVTFTDSGSLDYIPTTQTLTAVAGGASVSFIQSVTAPKNNGAFTAALHVAGTGTNPIPAAWVSTSPTSLSFSTTPSAGDTKSWIVAFTVPSGTVAGTYTAQIKANPSISGVGEASGTAVTLVITVPNTPPTVAADSASVTMNEGQTANNAGTYSDPDSGQDVIITASIGTVSKTGTNSGTWSWSYATTDGPTQSQTVTITANDGSGGISTTTFSLTVNNVPPIVNTPIVNPEPSDEGSSATASATFSDPGTNDAPFTCTVNYGDGSTVAGTVSDNTCTGPAHTYADNGAYTVTVSVTDKDSGTGSGSTTHNVNNVPPTIALSGAINVDEGAPYTLSLGAITDPGIDTVGSYKINWGDGASDTFSGSPAGLSKPHTYADGPKSYTITVDLTDEDGTFIAAGSKAVTVDNVAPTATFNSPASVNEGSDISLSLTNPSDPSSADVAAGFQYAFYCDDGSGYGSFGSASSATCSTSDNGVRTVKGKIKDKDGGESEYTALVTITNVAPTVTPQADQTVDEGASILFSLGSFSDPGINDNPWAVDVDWGDGSPHTTFNMATQGALTDQSHTYAEGPNSYPVTVKVTDKDGGSDSKTFKVTVNNVAPTATIADAPASSPEGTPISLSSTVTDPSSADTAAGFTYAWSVTKNGNPFAAGSGSSLSFTPDDNGNYVVIFTATDKDGGDGTDTKSIDVTNVAPTVTITGPVAYSVYAVGTPVTFTGTYTDPGTADTHTAQWTFDSTTITPVQSVSGGSVSTSYTFTTAGVYQVKLTVTDDDLGMGTATTVGGQDAYIVIYDPNAGFVTGGGWINSPSGAYIADPTMTGRANFGFVSKYQKGATVPTGETEFQFKAGNLNFHSTVYQWLVVSGAKAQYKGSGTINGAGSYNFLLTATDGQISGGGGVDKFRIKITDANGAVIYDNVPGASDDIDIANPLAIGGGSIVIHK